MRKSHLWISVMLVALLVVLVLVVVSCGSTAAAIDPKALFAASCAGCHSQVPGASLATAKAAIEKGIESMPAFTDKLTAAQIAALAAWAANGGK